MSERDADDAGWLPIIGLCITIPVWLWLRLTRPGRRQHGRRPAE